MATPFTFTKISQRSHCDIAKTCAHYWKSSGQEEYDTDGSSPSASPHHTRAALRSLESLKTMTLSAAHWTYHTLQFQTGLQNSKCLLPIKVHKWKNRWTHTTLAFAGDDHRPPLDPVLIRIHAIHPPAPWQCPFPAEIANTPGLHVWCLHRSDNLFPLVLALYTSFSCRQSEILTGLTLSTRIPCWCNILSTSKSLKAAP